MNISIIIPHRNSVDTINRLLNSIPVKETLEVIVVDNSTIPLKEDDIHWKGNLKISYSSPERFAGGARNVGLGMASGKWLVFADADDFFERDAFEIFGSYVESEFDLIYFGCNSVFDDTLQPSDRHLMYQGLVDGYLEGRTSEIKARLYQVVPWAKMIRRSLVAENNIRFDEVIAANDMYFATQVGYYAKSFHADRRPVYVVTTRRGSLANRWNYDILYSRYVVGLRRNQFLKQHGLSKYQVSVMIYLHKAFEMSPKIFFSFIMLGIKYKQNLFVGCRNWFKTKKQVKVKEANTKEYIVKE